MTNINKAEPKAYSRYFPVRENLPAVISTEEVAANYSAPSIVVMPRNITRGYDAGLLEAHLLFTVWDPGLQGSGGLQFNYEAWRDIVNMQDETARQLTQQMTIGGLLLELDRSNHTIQYGLVNDEEATPDLRPFYMGFMRAAFSYPVAPVKHYGKVPSPTAKTLLD